MAQIALSCQDVTVRFGDMTALDSVTAGFQAGQIHALLGQNGAGKSTLARFFAGIITPQTGQMQIGGTPVRPGNVHRVSAAGFDIVHQRFSLPPSFTVADALEMTARKKRGGAFFSGARLAENWRRVLADLDVDVPMSARLSDLPVATAQALEIARALADDARVLVLDEPTALLSPAAIEALFANLRKLKARGVTLILILHKLREVMAIADTVSVLRTGKLVLPPTPVTEVTSASLSDLMIGPGGAALETAAQTAPPQGPARLTLHDITSRPTAFEPGLQNLSLQVRAGEILGLAGVEGNGQRVLADILCGLTPPTAGRIDLDGQDLTHRTAAERRRLGLRAVPFDRMTEGASLDMSLWENATTWRAEAFAGRGGLLSIKAMRATALQMLQRFGVKFDTVDQPAGSLSGGNLQRVILARELSDGAKVLFAAQPTRGLDFKATDFVWHALRQLRAEGVAILLISSDLDELYALSDRMAVMRAGAIAGSFAPPFDAQAVGDAMVGAVR